MKHHVRPAQRADQGVTVSDIAFDEGNVRVEIAPMAAGEIVENGHVMAPPRQGRDDGRSNEACSTCDERLQRRPSTYSCYPRRSGGWAFGATTNEVRISPGATTGCSERAL